MLMQQIREIARDRGLKPGKKSKAELIHLIQEAEGNTPCFATATVLECGQDGCLWREDCLASQRKAHAA